ncbi:MAG TPA: hypothetical protein VK524_25320 [Polyangiaceae bacterium]|nr:hypothetical protein [Polyangiaceae bacterium]
MEVNEFTSVRTLPHGVYENVQVLEHRRRTGAHGFDAERLKEILKRPYVVLRLADGRLVIDRAQQFTIGGVIGGEPPALHASYRVEVYEPANQTGFASDGREDGSVRYIGM